MYRCCPPSQPRSASSQGCSQWRRMVPALKAAACLVGMPPGSRLLGAPCLARLPAPPTAGFAQLPSLAGLAAAASRAGAAYMRGTGHRERGSRASVAGGVGGPPAGWQPTPACLGCPESAANIVVVPPPAPPAWPLTGLLWAENFPDPGFPELCHFAQDKAGSSRLRVCSEPPTPQVRIRNTV